MPRFIVLLILGYLIYRFLKRVATASSARAATPQAPAAAAIGFTPIAACAVCGVHVPIKDSVTAADGQVFCCEAHSRLAHVPGR